MEWAWIALKNTTEQAYPFTSTASGATRLEQYNSWIGWWQTVSNSESYANQFGSIKTPADEKNDAPEAAKDEVEW